MDKNKKNKSQDPESQSHNTITHFTIFEDSSLHSSEENRDTNLALKDRKMDKLKEE